MEEKSDEKEDVADEHEGLCAKFVVQSADSDGEEKDRECDQEKGKSRFKRGKLEFVL